MGNLLPNKKGGRAYLQMGKRNWLGGGRGPETLQRGPRWIPQRDSPDGPGVRGGNPAAPREAGPFISGVRLFGGLILKKYLILGSGYFYGANKKLTDFLSAGVSQQH